MATIKSYTDINQSKKLAEFLPLESADMCYNSVHAKQEYYDIPLNVPTLKPSDLSCWSLATLFSILPSATLDSSIDNYYRIHCMKRYTEWFDNPIDACYEMIIKLHEQNII